MFNIQLNNGSKFDCDENVTIIESALKFGVHLDHSCLTGRCSSCKVQVLSGETIPEAKELSLSDLDKQQGYILACVRRPLTDIVLDAEDLSSYGLVSPLTIPAKINAIEQLTSEINRVTLRIPPNQKVSFLPGQYLNVIWNGIRRSYSIASTPDQNHLELVIKNYPGGQMSEYWFNLAKEDDLLRLELPKGTFFLREPKEAENIIFIATGTGIAPIKSILESSSNRSLLQQFKRVILLWGMKVEADLFWKPTDEVEFIPVLSRESLPKKYVQDVLPELQLNWCRTSVYACGSESMINTVKEICNSNGLGLNAFYADSFVPSN